MNKTAFKKVFDALPFGVFVFDEKLRVKFTNAAFRRSFPDTKNSQKTLAGAISCAEACECGAGKNCEYCAFYKVMRSVVFERAERTETAHTTVKRNGRTDAVSVRIRAYPIDEKGKLFLGLTDGSFASEMEREMLTAKRMQQRLLPAGKSMGGVPYSYMYIPCLGVGGDLPDVYELENQTYGVLADVSGKGISAGMLSAFVKAGFDRKQPDLAKALSSLCAKFNELNQDERSYITVAAVRIDKEKGSFRYATAGHNAPILLKNGDGIHEIEQPSMPVCNWVDGITYEERELPFNRGDLLALITDGVTESVNEKGEQFGIERTESVLLQSRNAEDFIGKLKTALSVFCGGKFSDDITAIAFDL
jgi:hypothetical protein